MLKKVLACAALLSGFSWAMAAPASADGTPAVKAGETVKVDAKVGAQVRVFDMSNAEDRCTLLGFILGLGLALDADVKADVKV